MSKILLQMIQITYCISSYIFMLIVAQLWKQNGDRLENKNGVWMYMEETWILPNEKEGQVGELVRIKHNIISQEEYSNLTFLRFTTMETN